MRAHLRSFAVRFVLVERCLLGRVVGWQYAFFSLSEWCSYSSTKIQKNTRKANIFGCLNGLKCNFFIEKRCLK